jgi:hypothetical protein
MTGQEGCIVYRRRRHRRTIMDTFATHCGPTGPGKHGKKKRDTFMKRYLVIIAALAFLGLPVVAGAEETSVPPELNWTATPPARKIVDTDRWTAVLAQLVPDGVITVEEQAHWLQPFVTAP